MSHSIVLASAQFPVPIGEAHLGDWQSVGVHGQFVHDSDRPLVVVNQGKEGDEGIGFDVCDKCGAAAPVGSAVFAQPRHQRPYLVDWGGARQQPIRCDGTPRTVFLGTTFTSDLLLLRTNLAGPLGTNMQSSVTREALEDSLRTLSEAILLAASRVLDIDPAELNCGFRIVPDEADDRLRADIYLFDTLSGGAGYADQAGHHMEIILDKTLELLEQCPGDCTHSCQECLRHYANQYWYERLDRFLAAHMLRYTLYGTTPDTSNLSEQQHRLHALQRMLELDGYTCGTGTQIGGCAIPLFVENRTVKLAIGTYSGLLDKNSQEFHHPLYDRLDDRFDDVEVELINEYLVDRNLPDAYQIIKNVLEN